MTRRQILQAGLAAPLLNAQTGKKPAMLWGDTSKLGRPFAKDPSVIKFRGRYLMYYSMPGGTGEGMGGWSVGIAESRNLIDWSKIGEVRPGGEYDAKGLAAPCAKVIEGKVHLFYQTYGNGAKDSICHATSADGLAFDRNPTNPIFKAEGDWNAGRVIDAELVRFKDKWFLYGATRDPKMKIQMLVAGYSTSGFNRSDWTFHKEGTILKPELPWEGECCEAPAAVVRGDTLYLFYAGAYNNAPQQIGCAKSTDGIHFTRLFQEPLLKAGKPGEWNSSESGHPGTFVDDDGQTYLFYQGNPDKGKTWLLSFVKIGWKNGIPFVMEG